MVSPGEHLGTSVTRVSAEIQRKQASVALLMIPHSWNVHRALLEILDAVPESICVMICHVACVIRYKTFLTRAIKQQVADDVPVHLSSREKTFQLVGGNAWAARANAGVAQSRPAMA